MLLSGLQGQAVRIVTRGISGGNNKVTCCLAPDFGITPPFPYLVTPIILPGMSRTKFCLQEKNPAWGPPYPNGTPNLCEVPTAMSTPNSAGGLSSVRLRRSVAQQTKV